MPAGLPLWQCMHLLKLVRVAILLQRWRQSNIQHINVLRLGTFVYWLLLASHWLACGWLALGGIPETMDTVTRYIRALYWCITTLATVGYGDITPSTNAQTVYAMVVMLLGVGVYGYVIGNVTTLLANIDLAKTHYRENMERLAAFMRYRHIPTPLQQHIRNYYAYLWANRLGYDETTILAGLPDSLRTEVALFLRRDFIERAPLFQGASQELIRELALELRPMVFTPGDYIFRAGQSGRHMCFISRGNVHIISRDGTTVVNTLSDGDFFGEIALLFSQPRTASVRAVDYCDVYMLDKDTFDRVLGRYPEFAAHIHEMARSRQVVQ
jgi:voltage-gated potassium channel